MLKHLAIRDIVLIRRLDLPLEAGLCVLTGETGAGKSIVLDALGLALGGRADRALVRVGAGQGSVAACFEPAPDHPAWAFLAERAIAAEGGELVLRRTLGADGRSRAFVNDEPVTGQLLRQLGWSLVEVHGQNDRHGLAEASAHRGLLDAFAGLEAAAAAAAGAHGRWREAQARERGLAAELERARRDGDDLRHLAAELGALAPQPGEEAALAERRQRLLGRGKLAAALGEALAAAVGAGGARERLLGAERRLERARALPGGEGAVGPAAQALARALVELDEAEAGLEAASRDLEAGGPDGLADAEERLFAIRDAARKHRVPPDALPDLLARTREALDRLAVGGDAAKAARLEAEASRARYLELAGALGAGRREAAARLDRAVGAELPPLKLERAALRVEVEALAEAEWGPGGRERVAFAVRTNPGQPFGPIARIASGGELSRFMLAIKAVLARTGTAGTLVFDEVDAGIGGATAAAVGERLARLAGERQVLVVTHAPQVAARAAHHFAVRKRAAGGGASVEVRALGAGERELEIARMLAGAEVTDAARAAARDLLERASA